MAITGDGLNVKGVGQVLIDHVFQVPPNQRAYSWEEENVSDFWHDILHAQDENPKEDYFIGTIVLSKDNGSELEVVDGQQRLATTTMIIAAVRDYFLENGSEPRAGVIENKYLKSDNEDTLEKEPRLSLNTDDNEFFQTHVVNGTTGNRGNPLDMKPARRLKESNRKIAEASARVRAFVHQHVRGMRSNDAADKLMGVIRYIRDHVKLICVTVPNHENAYTIFETLNDRGLELTKADLLKNHLFRTAGKRQKEAQSKWTQMAANLESVTGKDVTVDFIRYLWISKNGHVRGKELYARIKSKVVEQSQAVTFAGELAEASVLYAAILNSDHTHWSEYGEDTRIDLANLIMLGIERIHPITLAVVRNFQRKEEVKKSLYYLVAVSVRLLIAGPAPGGQFEKSIADLAPKITQGEIDTARKLATAMNQDIAPADAKFEAEFSVATVSQTHLARYYLRALNSALDPDADYPARIGKDRSTIEHILPQSRTAAWSHVKEDVAKAYVKRIGNLTLLPPKANSEAGNADFRTVKVPAYRKSGYKLTQEIADAVEWNEAAIDERQKRLAKLAVRVWPITVKGK